MAVFSWNLWGQIPERQCALVQDFPEKTLVCAYRSMCSKCGIFVPKENEEEKMPQKQKKTDMKCQPECIDYSRSVCNYVWLQTTIDYTDYRLCTLAVSNIHRVLARTKNDVRRDRNMKIMLANLALLYPTN